MKTVKQVFIGIFENVDPGPKGNPGARILAGGPTTQNCIRSHYTESRSKRCNDRHRQQNLCH